MANLPNIRLQPHVKPFANTGVDYFGPIQPKTSRKTRRNQGTLKTYEVIFTCLNTKAIISNFPVTCRLIPLFYRSVDFLLEKGMSTLCNPIMERIS